MHLEALGLAQSGGINTDMIGHRQRAVKYRVSRVSAGRSAVNADRSAAALQVSLRESPVFVAIRSTKHFQQRLRGLLRAPSCPEPIGVARIFTGVHFFPQKSWRPFFVVALKRRSKTTK